MLAVQADGGEVTTIEGLAPTASWHPVQRRSTSSTRCSAASARPGMIMAAVDLLRDNPDPTERGDPGRPGGQPLPLHRLPEHRPGRARGRRRDARRARGPGAVRRARVDRMTEQLDAGLVAEQIAEHPERLDAADGRASVGRGRAAQGGRPAASPAGPRWTDNITLPGMLHLAILRSPMAHARITRVDVLGGAGAARRDRRVQRRRPGRRVGALPCAWPVTADMVHPDHHAAGRRRGRATSARRSRSSSPATATPPPTRSRPSRSSTSRCRRSSTWRPRSAEARRWSTPTRAPTSASSGRLRRAGDDDAPSRPRPTPRSSSSARYVQQRLIPTAMEPRSVVVDADRGGRRVHDLLGHPDPAHPAADAGADHRHARAQDPGRRAGRRRRLRLEAQRLRRGGDRARRGPQARAAR